MPVVSAFRTSFNLVFVFFVFCGFPCRHSTIGLFQCERVALGLLSHGWMISLWGRLRDMVIGPAFAVKKKDCEMLWSVPHMHVVSNLGVRLGTIHCHRQRQWRFGCASFSAPSLSMLILLSLWKCAWLAIRRVSRLQVQAGLSWLRVLVMITVFCLRMCLDVLRFIGLRGRVLLWQCVSSWWIHIAFVLNPFNAD